MSAPDTIPIGPLSWLRVVDLTDLRGALCARILADLLRDGGKGYDAYVFHTTACSYVTVGAFESRTDENMEKAYYALAEFAKSQPKTSNFACMTIPQPMQIPGR